MKIVQSIRFGFNFNESFAAAAGGPDSTVRQRRGNEVSECSILVACVASIDWVWATARIENRNKAADFATATLDTKARMNQEVLEHKKLEIRYIIRRWMYVDWVIRSRWSYRWETVRSNYFRARRRQPQARAHGSLQSCRACERMPLFLLYSDSRLLVSTSRCVYCVDKCFFRCSVSNAAAADQSFFSLFFSIYAHRSYTPHHRGRSIDPS